MLKVGFVVNPFAGIGGSVGLKGSDGEQIAAHASQAAVIHGRIRKLLWWPCGDVLYHGKIEFISKLSPKIKSRGKLEVLSYTLRINAVTFEENQ